MQMLFENFFLFHAFALREAKQWTFGQYDCVGPDKLHFNLS